MNVYIIFYNIDLIEEMPCTSAEARALLCDAPSTPARTPRRAPKRKNDDEDTQNKFLNIAKMQADSLKVVFKVTIQFFIHTDLYFFQILADTSMANVESNRLLAEGFKSMGEGLVAMGDGLRTMADGMKACAASINNLANTMRLPQ